MSVSRSASEVVSSEYDDFDIQNVTVVADIETDLAAGQSLVEEFHNAEVAGGLSRDEVAELVGLHYVCSTNISGSDNDVNFGGQWEVSLDSDAKTIRNAANMVTDTDIDGITGLDREVIETTDPSVLLSLAYAQADSFEDETNGAGGAGVATIYNGFVPYRMWYGRGPTFDRHNELFWHFFEETSGDSEPEIILSTTFVWDIMDRSVA